MERWLENLSGTSLSLDGITLLQEFIKPADSTITLLEFIDVTFFYAVQVDTSEGFELCPADPCEPDSGFCTALDDQTNARKYKFTLVDGFYDNYLIPKLESFFSEHNIEIAAAEFVEDANGNRYVYDLNMNTNYNQQAEQEAGKKKRAMHHVATFLGDLLQNYNIPR
jgi:hypothetical protein